MKIVRIDFPFLRELSAGGKTVLRIGEGRVRRELVKGEGRVM